MPGIMMAVGAAIATMQALPPPAPPAAQAATAGQAAPLRRDRKGRPVIGVEIDGRGPFDMVVDTAAQSSLIAPDLAAELGLPRLSGGIAVRGATGVDQTALYGVNLLSSPVFTLRDVALPALANAGVTDARGIVGMEVATGRKLVFDQQAGTLAMVPSGPPAAGDVAVAGRLDATGLLVVPITINGRKVDALVDSGAEGIVAGPALLDMLGWEPTDPRLKAYGTMSGAGGRSAAVRTATIDTIQLGPVRFSTVPIIIAGPGGQDPGGVPRIILGANLLGLMAAYAVDFGRAELQIRVPGGAVRR